MTKWEYSVYYVGHDDERLEQTLNVKGSQGWELVSFVTVGGGVLGGSQYGVFKRPVVASSPRPLARG